MEVLSLGLEPRAQWGTDASQSELNKEIFVMKHDKFVREMSTAEFLVLISSNEMRNSEWVRKLLLVWHKYDGDKDYHPLILGAYSTLRIAAGLFLFSMFLFVLGLFFSWLDGTFSPNSLPFWMGFCLFGLVLFGLSFLLCFTLSSEEKRSLAHFRNLLEGIEMVAGRRFTILLMSSEREVRGIVEAHLVSMTGTLLSLQEDMRVLGRELTADEDRRLADAKAELEKYHGAVRFTGLADKEWTRYFQIAQRQLDEEAANKPADVMAGCG